MTPTKVCLCHPPEYFEKILPTDIKVQCYACKKTLIATLKGQQFLDGIKGSVPSCLGCLEAAIKK